MDHDFVSIIPLNADDLQQPGGRIHPDIQPAQRFDIDLPALARGQRMADVLRGASAFERRSQDLHRQTLTGSADVARRLSTRHYPVSITNIRSTASDNVEKFYCNVC